MSAQETYAEPRIEEVAVVKLNPALIGKTFSKNKPDAKTIMGAIKALENDKEAAMKFQSELSSNGSINFSVEGSEVKIDRAMVEIEVQTKKISSKKFTPSVIEPSFGIGRILYHIFEHSYYVRPEDAQRGVLALTPIIAGTKVAILPLSANEAFEPFINEINRALTFANISSKVDNSSAALGKRYARTGKKYFLFIHFLFSFIVLIFD